MPSTIPRTRRREDDPPRGRVGTHRLPRHGAWFSRLGAASLAALLAGLVLAWSAGVLPLRGDPAADGVATDVPIRVDPSGITDDAASRDGRHTGTGETASPEPSEESAPDGDEDDGGDDGAEPGTESMSETERLAAEAIRLTNVEREKAGCGAVHEDPRLTDAAQGHSEDMAANDYFSHTSQDGRSPWDRAREAGYDNAIGENIAVGYPTAEAVIEGWMNSEGHRENLLNCDARAIGLGVARQSGGQLYWTQMFGSS